MLYFHTYRIFFFIVVGKIELKHEVSGLWNNGKFDNLLTKVHPSGDNVAPYKLGINISDIVSIS